MKTEKLSVAPVFHLQALSACGEEGLTSDHPLVDDVPTRQLYEG